jgi:hypothetical protein
MPASANTTNASMRANFVCGVVLRVKRTMFVLVTHELGVNRTFSSIFVFAAPHQLKRNVAKWKGLWRARALCAC